MPYVSLFNDLIAGHGRTGRKKLGGRKEICPTFRIMPENILVSVPF